jgi:PilZ domain
MHKLRAQQFAEILEALRVAGASDGSERRQHTRMEVQARVKLAVLQGDAIGTCFTGLTRDVSASGVGIIQSTPAANGARFILAAPGAKSELHIICISRFCRALAEGVFGIGAEFDALATAADIEAFKKSETAMVARMGARADRAHS